MDGWTRRDCSHCWAADWLGHLVSTAYRLLSSPAHRARSSSPGVVVANVHSVGASLTVWFAAGVLAWTGASSFAELGSSIPVNGGAQAYLQYSYGPLVSYLFAWTAISALKPGTLSSLARIPHACRTPMNPLQEATL